MCGLAGILRWDHQPDRQTATRMAGSLRHRGPDAEQVVVLPSIVLAHRRLAVIDLSECANQPLADGSRQFWIVYNGELYNFRELRNELQREGAVFATHADTEVILEAFKRWGVDCLARLNGMFAFAIWDAQSEMLFLARDRAGEKPLYYLPLPDGVAFASEVHTLRLHPDAPRTLNPQALGCFLSTNYVVGPDALSGGIKRLAAAHFTTVTRKGIADPVQYWDLAAAFHRKRTATDVAAAAEELRHHLDAAVRGQLVSDVPLGAFLSGGLDSSSVVASMCAARPPAQNTTFSIGFNEDTFDERPFARHVARLLGAEHHERVTAADMATALPRIVRAADEPMADTSIIPMYYLAQFAREKVTVCLSGDGSDEIFGGYETYLADQLFHAIGRVPQVLWRVSKRLGQLAPVRFNKVDLTYKMRQFVAAAGMSPQRAHISWRGIFDADERRQLVHRELHQSVLGADPLAQFDAHFAAVRNCHYLDQAMYVDFKTWLADDILVKVDRMTMAHGLESRAPFLDHRVVEFAASLPVPLKVRGMTTKYLLKRSQQDRLPRAIIDRGKRGFNAPVSRWFAGPLAELGREATSPRVLGEWFDPAVVRRLWDEHLARKRDNGFKLFGLVCLGLWLEQRA